MNNRNNKTYWDIVKANWKDALIVVASFAVAVLIMVFVLKASFWLAQTLVWGMTTDERWLTELIVSLLTKM